MSHHIRSGALLLYISALVVVMEEAVAVRSGSQGSPVSGSAEPNDGTAGYWQSASACEQDMFLPIANISRIMKRALPANAKIAKEAKESLQECVTEFIGFITSEANDKCLKEKRKTINGDDLIWAMTTLGFENYVEPLTIYLHRYRESEGDIAVTAGSHGGSELPFKKDENGSASLPSAQH